MTQNLPSARPDLASAIGEHLLQTVAVDASRATATELMQALAQAARAQLSQRWVRTQAHERETKARRV